MNWLPHRKLHMYNYFSVGVDAQVTFNFHKARESPFYMMGSRIFNKVNNEISFYVFFVYYNYPHSLFTTLFISTDFVYVFWDTPGSSAGLCWS